MSEFIPIKSEILGISCSVLFGASHQGHYGGPDTAGRQCTCAVAQFIAFAKVRPGILSWKTKDIDTILEAATGLYDELPIEVKDDSGFVDPAALNRRIVTAAGQVKLSISKVGNEVLKKAEKLTTSLPELSRSLDEAISSLHPLLITTNDVSVGLVTEGEDVFLFNSHSTGSDASSCSDGKACIICLPKGNAHEIIANYIEKNYGSCSAVSHRNLYKHCACTYWIQAEISTSKFFHLRIVPIYNVSLHYTDF